MTRSDGIHSEAAAVAETATPDRILQIGLGFWAAKTLLSAVELGLWTDLAHGPRSLEELTERLGLHYRSARDFLDALVALRVLQRDGDRYATTPDTDLFLDRNKASYIGGMLEMANSRLYGYWGNLTEGLRTGQPQNELKEGGLDLFSAMALNPARLRGFMQAMTGLSMGAATAIAQKFPWQRYRTFADVGTAQGGLPVMLTETHPHLHGVGVDLPNVQPIFEEYVRAHGVQDRLRWQAADIWTDPFPPADVIVLGHMLHGWGLERKKILLQKAYEAVPAGGAVIVYDAIIDDDRRENAFGLLFSLNMLIENAEGAEYTGADCTGWMRAVGFTDAWVEPLVGPESLVVGLKGGAQ
ncbi:MAG: methyltransferase [Chloroflexota bacterium]